MLTIHVATTSKLDKIIYSNDTTKNKQYQCWKFPQKIISHQGWQVLKVVSPDEKLSALVPHENSGPETTKQARRTRKQLGRCIDYTF